jgi:hypothetical protein
MRWGLTAMSTRAGFSPRKVSVVKEADVHTQTMKFEELIVAK